MQLQTDQLGIRFHRSWLFQRLDICIASGDHVLFTGANGSGKSTLFHLLSGLKVASAGTVHYQLQSKEIEPAEWYQHYAFVAPYLELPEELTLNELLKWYFSLKRKKSEALFNVALEQSGLAPHLNKELRWYSSGMKQRVKLLLGFYTDVPLLFLDEPGTNLDAAGIEWYQNRWKEAEGRTILLASNDPREQNAMHRHFHLEQRQWQLKH
jgi:ABC-type multidrug transport system ATPase subunit